MNAEDIRSENGQYSLQDLLNMEGRYVFQCEFCESTHSTVMGWAQHRCRDDVDFTGLVLLPKN
jgi:hypothetical protein